MRESSQRYTAVAIVLHWAIATAILGNLTLGWWMRMAIDVSESQARAVVAFQLHKSIGLTVLALSVLRLLWRLTHPVPSLPAGMATWERVAAKATHWAFYGLMIAVPFLGWLYVSTQWRNSGPLNIPTLWFGVFEVPHLFGLEDATRAMRESVAALALRAHTFLAWSTGVLFVLHVAAALKHHFINRDDVLEQMIPALQAHGKKLSTDTGGATPNPVPLADGAVTTLDRGRTAILVSGVALVAIASAAIGLALIKTPASEAPRNTEIVSATSASPDAVTGTSGDITSAAGGWVIDPALSEIAYAGVHAGAPFRGRFTRWDAALRLDAADATRSQINATIDTASATDGVPLHDETLPLSEWFDVAAHPTASFRATSIRKGTRGEYEVHGVLTIKGHEIAVAPLALQITGDGATIQGRSKISRSAVDLGMESDPDAHWVSADIDVEIRVVATRTSAR